MKLSYFDLLSPEPIPLYQLINKETILVGTVKPMTPRYIAKNGGFGDYSWFLNSLSLDVTKYFEITNQKEFYETLSEEDKQKLNIFDLIISQPQIREVIENALSFFMIEKIKYVDEQKMFFAFNEDDLENPIGIITRNYYSQLANIILQLNGMQIKENVACKVTPKAQAIIDKINKAKERMNKNSDINKDFELANIMSKLSSKHNSINMLNIWDMTIYQIYDQFYEQNHQNIISMNEINHAYWGGDFDVTEWYKRLNK